MESIVSKALAKYFKKFIKDFKSEQFTVSLTKGTAKLTDLELDGAFIQHVMMIPPNTEIRHCTCNELSVAIPGVTKFNDKPVVLSLDKVFLTLEEPETIKPIPAPTKTHQKKKSITGSPLKGTRKGLTNFVRDMKVIINEAHFDVKLLPRDEPNATSTWAPHLRFDLYDVVIESTNGSWEVMKLSKCITKDSARKLEKSYKLALCRSVSIALISSNNSANQLQIVDKLPVEIHVTTETSTVTNETLGVDLFCILDEVRFSWNQISWGLVVKLFSSLRFCLEREIPREIKVESKAKIRKQKKKVSGALENMDMKYRLLVRTWSMSFLTNLDAEADCGYRFEGSKLSLDVSPKRRIKGREGKEDLFESSLLWSIESFSFGEVSPNPLIEPRVNKVISQIPNSSSNQDFMSVTINHRWAKLNQPKSTNLFIKLSGLQVVLDREVMKGFYKFLSDDIITIAKEDHHRAKMEKTVNKLEKAALAELEGDVPVPVEKQVEEIIDMIKPPKMSDYFYWFHSSDVRVIVSDTNVIIPKDYYVRKDGIQLHRELRAYAKQVSFGNLAEWTVVPHLSDSLKALSSSELSSFVQNENTQSNKFQLNISDVCLETHDPQTKESSIDTILLPTTLKIYGRFIEKVDGVDIQPDMELAIHASEFKLTITEEQENYFKEMIPMYQRWYHKLDKEIKSVSIETKQEIKAKLVEGKKTALNVATKLAESNAATNQILEKAKTSRVKAVEDAIKSFQFAYTFQAELGSFCVPLHNIGEEPEAPAAAGEEIVKSVDTDPLPLSSFTFKKMNFVVENTIHHQSVCLRLGAFEAKDLDHPKSPSSLALLPLAGASDFLEDRNSSFVIDCNREYPASGKAFTTVMVYLQGMQIVSQAKREAIRGMHKELEAAIPDLKRIGQKITDTLVGLKADQTKVDKINRDVDKAKKKLTKGVNIAEKALDFLDLSWAFNVSDCELVLLEHDWTANSGKKPFGCIKVSSFNKDKLSNRFDDLNQDLIMAKLKLAEADSSIGAMTIEKRNHQEIVDNLNKQLEESSIKARKELESVEQQLIETKMTLVEAQIQLQELQAKLARK